MPNTKCGHILYLEAEDVGMLFIDDEDLFFSPAAQSHFERMGFDLSKLEVSVPQYGRRLAGGAAMIQGKFLRLHKVPTRPINIIPCYCVQGEMLVRSSPISEILSRLEL